MSSWPLVRVMVPVVAKSIASAPGLALAASTAARSEPAPLSARLRTVKVLGTVRSSRGSTLRRVGRFRAGDTKRERADRSQDDRRMAETPWEAWSAIQWRDIAAGAQTERRSGAGPVRGLLAGKDPTGRFSCRSQDTAGGVRNAPSYLLPVS